MANYVSKHTGSQIDEGVEIARARPWRTLSKVCEAGLWTDSETNAKYQLTVNFKWFEEYNPDEDSPIAWFVNQSGIKFYADSIMNSNGSMTVFSNTQLQGTLFVLGITNANGIE